jgi:hypothetical protein
MAEPASSFPQPAVLQPSLPQSNAGVDRVGVQFRAAAIGGQGPVQDQSIAPIEMFPFFIMDNSLFFSDLRFFPTIDGTFGGNTGFGYRYYSPGFDRILGISGWYDSDGTRSDYFQQLGLSLESYGSIFDFRTNLYLPVGTTYRQTSISAVDNSARFVGDNVAYDLMTGYIAAMRGIDMEVGVPIPGKFAHDHGLRVYGGWYYFADDQGDHIFGGSARVQANLYEGIDAAVQVTNDNFFDTRAFVNVSWTFGPLRRSDLSGATVRDRLAEHVTRNYTVLAPTRTTVQSGLLAVDPQTGTPYTFAHVDSAAGPGGNGNFNSPFQTIGAAQSIDRDIIFVHANSVFHGAAATVVMSPGQVIVGDGAGVQHSIAVPQIGSLILPHAAAGTNLPILDSSAANSVTLASNSVFSGFAITNAAANGIFGNGVSNVLIHDVNISNSGTNGISLLNSSGTLALSNMSIANSAGNGLAITGGSANIQFGGQIAGSQGYDLNISNTSGGTVDMTNALFTGSGSHGILLQNDAGNVNFSNLTVMNSVGTGIDIESASGSVQFAGTTTVAGAAATSVAINNLLSTGSVTFNDVTINNRHDAGIAINNAAGAVTFNGTTTVTNEGGTSPSAISVANSSGNVTFGTVNVVGSTINPGVSLQNNSGTTTFALLDIASVNGTGLFANNAGTLNINSSQTANGGTINATNGAAVDIENTAVNVDLMTVSANGGPAGIKLINSPGTFFVVGNSNLDAGSGGTIQNAAMGVVLQNVGTVGLASMNLTSNGLGISAQNVGTLQLNNLQITNSATYGIDALDVKTLSLLNSTLSGNGAANIRSQYDRVGAYSATFTSNTLTSTSADNIFIQTLAGSEGSTLNLTVQQNAIQNGQNGTAGLNLTWNGNLTANVSQNTFTGSGTSNEAVRINSTSTNDLATISVTNNSFTAGGSGSTGFDIATAGPAQLTLTGNTVQFNATSGTGFKFSLGPGATVDVASNSVVDTTDGATGILFGSVTGPGSITIDNNSVSLANLGPLVDRGIIFSSVTDPTISNVTYVPTLVGTQSNTIQGAVIPFSVPGGTTTGTILVNGTLMP